jgi:prevent-host-death family protein
MLTGHVMTITATEFKAKCLKLMDKMQKAHHPILITKRGQVVAQLAPPPAAIKKPWLALRGMTKITGGIAGPAMTDKEIAKWIKREAKHIRGVFD